MKQNRGVVQVAQDVHTKGVDCAMTDQQRRIDSNCLGSCWLITLLHGRNGRNEVCAAKSDAGSDSDLAKEIKPACYPGGKRGVLGWCKHEGPEVGTAGCGDGGDDFGHAEGDGEGEEGDYEPADGHGCAETC